MESHLATISTLQRYDRGTDKPSQITRQNSHCRHPRRRHGGLSHVERFIQTLINQTKDYYTHVTSLIKSQCTFTTAMCLIVSKTFMILSNRVITLSMVLYAGFLLQIMTGRRPMGQSGIVT